MKKILVILTGGTIGSVILGNDVDVTDTSPYRLINRYQQVYGGEDEFEVRQPLTVLSENMQPGLWNVLCQAITVLTWALSLPMDRIRLLTVPHFWECFWGMYRYRLF